MWSAGTHDEGTPQQHGKGKRTMFAKRLFQLAPGLKKLISWQSGLMWVGLLANIGFYAVAGNAAEQLTDRCGTAAAPMRRHFARRGLPRAVV